MNVIVAQLDATGRILAVRAPHLLDEAVQLIRSATGWVEITQAQHRAFQAADYCAALVDGVVVPLARPLPALDSARAQAATKIDQAAELARARFLTQGAGQALEYQATLADAKAAVAAHGTLNPADYPWLAAEQRAQATDKAKGRPALLAVAQSVVAQDAAWATAGAAIKELRRTAKIALAAASTHAEIDAVVAGLRWPRAEGGVDPDPRPLPPDPPPPAFSRRHPS